ncbi:dirigent protein 4 [Manihot esculenta]|uniref:Dirigent protein n=1 Tax=Manihot esculenta TaxID=3983 RepID=A0A2C9W2S2_MANES|nr:dirigent protein 4 [Manihot esculenta]OAY52367.1 hypothetical protein MANES_04G077600v8 [Manihot esculenta]
MQSCQILELAFILCLTATPVYSQYYSKTLPYKSAKNKVTNLHFFFHDTLSGENPSAILIASPNITNKFQFGKAYAIDDPLTLGPEPTSHVIGNAQGFYLFSGKESSSLVSYYDLGFTEGEFNGSSFSLFSRNPVEDTERELAVVGGRGKFRSAEGFALLKTYYFNLTTGDAVVEYDVTLIHY